MAATFDSTKAVFIPSNTGGVMVEVDPNTTVDNIFVFASGGHTFKWVGNVRGEYPLSQARILNGDVTDYTALLQTIFDHTSIDTVVLDAQQSVYISGTLNAKGKTIRFTPGSKFTGTGTILDAIISADYMQQIFDTTVSLVNCNVADDMFSVMWYGAVNDNTEDAAPAIQKAIDTVIANQVADAPKNMKNIFFPAGSYFIGDPIIVYKWSGVKYLQVTVNLLGEFDYAGTYPNGTRINCGFRDTFAFGIQHGKSCSIEGFLFLGQFVPPEVNGRWFDLTFEEFTDNLSRDEDHSPYSAVVIDPFTNGPLPADWYPNLEGFYRGDGTVAGSTGISVRNCFITNFVVGVITSPNGITRNAELTFIEKCQFAFCKICVAGCQDQEKANKVYDLMCWANTHTIFATGLYGAKIPGNWYVEIVNVAGSVNQLVYNNGLGYYPSYFDKVFAESVGKVGFLSTDLQSSFRDSVIDLQRFDPGGGFTPMSYNWAITGTNTLYENCVIRYYGTAYPVAIMGRNVFRNCYFETEPYNPSGIMIDGMPYGIDAQGPSVFQNCTVNGDQFSDPQDAIVYPAGIAGHHICYGKKKFIDKGRYRQGSWEELEIDGSETCSVEYWAATFNLPPFNVTVDTSTKVAEIDVTAAHIYKFRVGRPVICNGNNFLMGIVTNINTSTNIVTVGYLPTDIVSGSYYIGCVHQKNFYAAFIGDLTASSNVITNVVFDIWGADAASMVGTMIELPQIVNFAFTGKYQNLARILAYDSGAKTITLDIPANETMAGRYISIASLQKNIRSYSAAGVQLLFPPGTILPSGSRIYLGDDVYVATKTGFVNAAAIGGGETRQAQWIKLGQDPQELADDATADLMGLRMYYNTSSNVVKIKNNTTWLTVTAT